MKTTFIRYVAYTLCVCLSAWIVGMPLSASHFNQVFTFGWPFSALLLPLVSLTMFMGFSKLLLTAAWPSSALLTGPVLEWLTRILIAVVEVLARVPAASIDVPAPPWWWLVVYYTLLAGLVIWRWPGRTKQLRTNWRWPVLATCAISLLTIPAFLSRWPTHSLRVTVLSVGAGSATLIELPDGRTCLYDAGTTSDFDIGKQVILPALRERGVRRIDALLLSHANYDHYSGLISICDSLAVDQVILTPHFEAAALADTTHRKLLEELRRRSIPVRQLTASSAGRLTWPAVQTDVIWPPQQLAGNVAPNDCSLVIRLAFEGRSVLLTGDIDQFAEERLLNSGIDLHADVLLLPHHGSINPATGRFLDAVKPSYVVRSSNLRRRARLSDIERLAQKYLYWNTADSGAVTITLTKQELSVQPFRLPNEATSPGAVRSSNKSWE